MRTARPRLTSCLTVRYLRKSTVFFFLNDPAPPDFYPLPLPDALPILVVERPAAADMRRRHPHVPPGRFDGLHGGHAGVGVHVVVERVREDDDLASAEIPFAPPVEIGRAHV